MGAFFVRRPVVAMVIAIVMIIVGIVAGLGLPISEYPDISPPLVKVTAAYRGANAEVVEQTVATPIEQQINGVDNMLALQSFNANDGTTEIRVSFEIGTNVDINQVNTQNRASQATPQLPEDVNREGVKVLKSMPDLLMVIALSSPGGTYDSAFLSNYAEINVMDALRRVKGVGDATNFTAQDYSMRLWLRPDRLAKLGMTAQDVIAAVKEQNVQAPAGQIGAEPAPPGQEFQYNVRTKGRLTEAAEFGEIIVRSLPDGSQVKVKDVARVELGSQLYNSFTRLDGGPACVLGTYLFPGANAIDTGRAIQALMEDAASRFPPDLEYAISLDTTKPVIASMEEILHTLLEAVALVILVVFVFLQSFRATLIPMATVPVSLIATFALFPLFGFSINTLSLFGLVLAIGIVVDDAIVVVEAVQHHIEHGKSPRDATLQAMKEVSGPVVAIALVLCAVFVPVGFMEGLTGRLYQQFAITIAISVVFSAINALTLSPALSALLMKAPEKDRRGPMQRFYGAFNRGFGKVTDGYVAVVKRLVARPALSMLLLAGIVALTAWLGMTIPAGFVPDEDKGYFFAAVQLPDAASQQRTDALMQRMEKLIQETPGVEYCTTVGGLSLMTNTRASNTGSFFVSLEDWKERTTPETSLEGILAKVGRDLASFPEAVAFPFPPPPVNGYGNASGFQVQLQDRGGGDVAKLAGQCQVFLGALAERPELSRLYTGFRADVPQISADLDRDKARKLGVKVDDVFQTLATYLGGAYINDFNLYGQVYRVYAQAEPEFRVEPEDLQRFYVRSEGGEMVPLSTLVRLRDISGPEYTTRYSLYRSAEISGAPAPGYTSGQALHAVEEVAAEVLPPDMGIEWSGISLQQKRSEGKAAVTFGLAILMVFLLLAAQYESWSLPWSVLLGTPFAVLGAFVGLMAARLDLNVYGQVGLILLIGLAAKNAILIVEFAKVKHEEGMSLQEAAIEAGRLRLRPILMTSFAFILGVVPLMLASGAGSAARRVLGTAVFAGMTSASTIGLFLIPVLYVVVGRFGSKKAAPAPAGARG